MSFDSSRRWALWLCGLWAVALGVRLLYLWEVSDSPLWRVVMGDARSYDAWARTLAGGDWLGSEVFYQAPLYPYVLGAVYATFGDGPWAIRVLQCLLGATGCVLLAVTGARLLTRRVGLTAGLLLAFYPPAIFYDGLIQKTALTSFLLCMLLAIAAGLTRRPDSITRWILAGVTTGLLALVRENALILAVLMPLWIVWAFRKHGRRRFGWVALALAGTFATLLPVAARNRYVGGEWHVTTSQFGPNLYIGNHAGATGFYEPLVFDHGDPLYERSDATLLAEQAEHRPLSPRDVSRYWTRRTLNDIAADPFAWLRLLGLKLWYAYNRLEIIDTEDQYTYAEYSPLLRCLMAVWHMGVLAPLAVFGAVVSLRRRTWRRRLAWPLLVIVGYTASVVLFFLLGRYRYPLVPPLMLFAAAGLWFALRTVRRTQNSHVAMRGRPTGVFAAALGLAALVAVPANRLCGSIDYARSVTRANLGKHFYLAGFPPEQIVAEYDRAVSLMPDDLSLRSNYAKVLWELDRPAAARHQLETALAKSPDDAVLQIELGLMLRELGEVEESAETLRDSLADAPGAPEPPYHLAITLLMQADEAAAHAAAAALDADSPDSPEAQRAQVGRRQANALRVEAAGLLQQSLKLDEDSDATHAALGYALASLGRREQAAREYARAAALAPPGSERQTRLKQRERQLSAQLSP